MRIPTRRSDRCTILSGCLRLIVSQESVDRRSASSGPTMRRSSTGQASNSSTAECFCIAYTPQAHALARTPANKRTQKRICETHFSASLSADFCVARCVGDASAFNQRNGPQTPAGKLVFNVPPLHRAQRLISFDSFLHLSCEQLGQSGF